VVRVPEASLEEVLARHVRAEDNDAALASTVQECADRALALEGRSPSTRLRWAMGEAMRALLGQAEPGRVHDALAEILDPRHESGS
jgi:Asp-tRNA(Asn)/Glu-tRNA(Gln) amidotransferase B subunit